jgi:hypothetical protein
MFLLLSPPELEGESVLVYAAMFTLLGAIACPILEVPHEAFMPEISDDYYEGNKYCCTAPPSSLHLCASHMCCNWCAVCRCSIYL